ncbi:uncharacterized protein EAF01_011287 [Botrytis porri]|uniref:Uncharacterized protein n=1 Tax=Botrytis porri TaxID=87229 RepID=A0A4Z1KKQ4_9HELO|nr:uncharacterized protein EAF01_011287 [Botrytis porri]KAF7886609.1 hypothetical protein EAF01_011287 [Botrytis porri]TGO86651.1 hypothetical protein BPOR_0286g00010 [Botrytis porri]
MDKINTPARLAATNDYPEMFQILSPEKYLERGTAVFNAIQTAINANPVVDVSYPDWNIRYVNIHRFHNQVLPYLAGFNLVFSDPQLQIESAGAHWSSYTFFSRAAIDAADDPNDLIDYDSVAQMFVSPKTGTAIMSFSNAAADTDIPDVDTPRLYNSELLYQGWRDACNAQLANGTMNESQLRKLKYIICGPIVNLGTLWTIRDVLTSQEVPEFAAGQKSRFTVDSSMSLELKMLIGTANGRAFGRLCADHAATLGKKQIEKIHIFYPFEEANEGTLVFELNEDSPVEIQRRPTARERIIALAKSNTTAATPLAKAGTTKVGRKVSERVKGLMKKFEN